RSWQYRLSPNSHAYPLRSGAVVACAPGRVVELTPDRRMVGETPMAAMPDVARACMNLARFGLNNQKPDFDLEMAIDFLVECLRKKNSLGRLNALKRLAE